MNRNRLSIKIDDWKKFEKNILIIAFNILYIKLKKCLQLISQKLIQIVKKKNSINDSK